MNCKNCNYILTGKENFCPNCGTIPESTSAPFPKIKEIYEIPKVNPLPEKPKSLNEILFTEPTEESTDYPEVRSFRDDNSDSEDFSEQTAETKDKKAVGKIFFLLFLCCALAVSAFGLADYFGITPRLKNYISTFSQSQPDTSKAPTTTAFSHADTVIHPDVNCARETAYIFSGTGLTLRKGPANSYAPLYSLTDLTMVQIFGSSLANPEWVYVYCPEKDSYGWLNGSFVCSDVVIEDSYQSQYESEEDVPTNYYY